MKTCPACNLDFEDEFVFCFEDGSRLHYNVAPETQSPVYKAAAATPRVLFCQVCQREYPLTFSNCPVDGFRLAQEKIVAAKKVEPAPVTEPLESVAAEAQSEAEPIQQAMIEDEVIAETDGESDDSRSRASESLRSFDLGLLSAAPAGVLNIFRKLAKSESSEEGKTPNLRFAARATIVGLLVFGLVSAYVAYDYLTRRPKLQPPVKQAEIVENRAPFIPTPQSARDYVEEEPQDEVLSDLSERAKQRGVILTPSRKSVEASDPSRSREPAGERLAQKPVSARESVIAGPIRPQSTGGRIDARLLQVRSSRTRPGVRYDLTFVLDEQAGRTVRWERMIISTVSARGESRTETLPFHHRHGAEGSLRFTVSVQMQGASESDVKGKIVCTTIGSDDSGRQMRASFGANVTP